MYTPTPNVFVNGNIIDGQLFTNEFNKISEDSAQKDEKIVQETQKALSDAKEYTDTTINEGTIDGGTF